jgi:lipopolysaccharide/colanic/teichoic acid biosynthesis glycosyltransferase
MFFKRLLDLIFSFIGLILLLPILLVLMALTFFQDYHAPLFIANRVGKNEVLFKMVKLRSMSINSEKTGVNSTALNDPRVTPFGVFIRKYKFDELFQLWNVLIGDMSFVGPRPNVPSGVKLYTKLEKKLLTVRPGITDFSSIIFSDEADILKDSLNPDDSYNQLIRPWKSRLGLIYVENHSVFLDLKLIFYTIISIFSKKTALNFVISDLKLIGIDKEVLSIAKREKELYPLHPPNESNI